MDRGIKPDKAKKLINSWIKKVHKSELKHLIKFAKTVCSHFDGILNYFDKYTTNGIAEGTNSIIQTMKRVARGFRSFENFRTTIYLKKSMVRKQVESITGCSTVQVG
ncbi:hypothetical protein FACS1894120_5280 [Clostridia bacterium]|nr:hypothetical protein FACS1894120_5280 [Clostridia bacterium]